MSIVLLSAILLTGIVVLTPLAPRIGVPLPILLTIFGLLVPLFSGVPALPLNPDLILPIVLPPLLFAATQRSSAREFRDNARPIFLLAVGLTLASAAVVAVVAHFFGLGWGLAVVLGAIVAPPDPVAATAVARRLRLPERLVTVLEGEGMFNDATALVLYNVAVLVVVSGEVTVFSVGLDLLIAVVGGVVLGLVAGELTRRALAVLHDAAAETTITVAVPFGAYILADHLGASGVLAVLVLGLYLRTYGHSAVTSDGWLLGRAVWRYADYLITSLVFVLIGFELTAILEESDFGGDTVQLTAAVVATVVVFRILWMFPAAALARAWHHRRDVASPIGFRETAVVSWAGMRGVVTVATALALPATLENGDAFPDRGVIVIVGLVCVLATLVVQGLTLAPLVQLLGVGSEADTAAEVAELRHRAAEAALEAVRDLAQDPKFGEPVGRAAVMQYEGYLSAQSALTSARGTGLEEGYQQQLAEILTTASNVERDVVLESRRSGEFSAGATDEVLQDVEARAVRDFQEPG